MTIRHFSCTIILAFFVSLTNGSLTVGTAPEATNYLVAGHGNSLPNAAAIAAAGGTWMGQIASIGVALVQSSDSRFLTKVRRDSSVALAGRDIEVTASRDRSGRRGPIWGDRGTHSTICDLR